MKAQGSGDDGRRRAHRCSMSNVYEVAVASAREAKRMNARFFVADEMPPENVVVTAIRRVTTGEVAYRFDGDDSRSVGRERASVHGRA